MGSASQQIIGAAARPPSPSAAHNYEIAQSKVVTFLKASSSHKGNPVTEIVTHGARVFLAGDRAYKLKRAVTFSFMDFSTIGKRRSALEAELLLNRLTASSLYLKLLPLSEGPDGVVAWGDVNIVDWVLVMRRFNQADLLSERARSGKLTSQDAIALTDTIFAMHRKAPIIRRDEAAYFAEMAMANFATLEELGYDSLALTQYRATLRAALDAAGGHLEMRTKHGFVRRGHGDLHLDNIVMIGSAPTPFDALEFDDNLATGDVYYDLAYLLVDLDHCGLGTIANVVMNRYAQLSGDIEGLTALPLFMSTRALVRAKVVAIQRDHTLNPARDEVGRWLAAAEAYLRPTISRLIAIGGLSGTGKTSVSAALASTVGAAPGALVVRSDLIRKSLHRVSPTTRLPKSAYSEQSSERVYYVVVRDVERGLSAGLSVIADAVFSKHLQRSKIESAARHYDAEFCGIWLDVATSTRKARVSSRTNDASDADADVVDSQDSYDVGPVAWHHVDAEAQLDDVVTCVRQYVR